MLTKLSVKNVAIVVLLTLLVAFAGGYAIPRLGIEFLPEISPPVVSVVTVYPNASPDAVAHDVTRPIEDAIGSLPAIEKLRSVSNENVSIVIAEFGYGTNMEKTEEKVAAEINRIKGELPESAMEPKVARFNMNDAPIMSLSVTSKGGQAETSRIVKEVIKPEIEKVQGVASVDISGLAEKRYEVVLDPEKLRQKKLTSTQVVQILQANNLTVPGGSLDIGSKSIPIQTISRVRTKADLEKLIVSVSVDNKKVEEMQAEGMKDAMADAMVGMQKQAAKAQEQALKKAFEAQQKVLMQQVQAMIQQMLKDQMRQMPSGGQLPGGQYPGYPVPQGKIPGGAVPNGKVPQSLTPQPQQNPGVSPNTGSATRPGRQLEQGKQSSAHTTKPRAILASTKSMGSLGSLGGGMSGASVSSSASGKDVPINVVYLQDVAEVREAYDKGASIYRTNRKPSIGIDIKKGTNENTVAVADAVIAKIPELERKGGDGTKVLVASNQAEYIKNALEGMVREGILGALFAVLVIFFFLRSVRSTLVAAISIPLSVIIGLVFLYLADISLNVFTLGGITIAIGRVVDDSIVVLENIFRHMQTTSERRLTSVLAGTNEVARAITASTITTVAVFLPLGFVEGFVGELFRPFAYTVTLTLLASLIVALTIVPVLAARFMSRTNTGHAKENTLLKRAYMWLLRWSLRRKGFVLVLALALFAGSLALLPQIPQNFISQPNKGSFTISVEMPVGTSLAATSGVAAKVEEALAKDDRIQTFRTLVGTAQGSYASGGGSDVATIYATVTDEYKERKGVVVNDTRSKVQGIDDKARIAVSGAEQLAGMDNTIEVNVTANSYDDLKQANAALTKALTGVEEIDNVKSNLSQSKPELWVEVNEPLAMKKGLTAIQVAAAVRGAVNGESATTLEHDGVSTDVYVKVDEDKVKDKDTLAALPIVTPFGETLTLDAIAWVKMAEGPVNITRIDGERSATLTMEPVIKNTGAASRAVKDAVHGVKLPAGVGVKVAGVSTMMDEGFASMGMALAVAVILVYMVMVATFRSLLHPFTMMFSLPLAVIGALAALFITGRELGMPSLIGVLMLVGIVVTNAIVLLDLVQQLRAGGLSAYDAVVQAGASRMRPIVMTALSTILALIPMAVGSTEGGIISAPLATVVIGGLLTSTLLTLIVVPVLYMAFDAVRERLGVVDSSVVPVEAGMAEVGAAE